MKLKDILALDEILGQVVKDNKGMKGKDSFKLSKLIKAISEDVKNFNEVRKDILNKYCKKDENGELIVVDDQASFEPDTAEEFKKEYEELLNTAVNIDICIEEGFFNDYIINALNINYLVELGILKE